MTYFDPLNFPQRCKFCPLLQAFGDFTKDYMPALHLCSTEKAAGLDLSLILFVNMSSHDNFIKDGLSLKVYSPGKD